VDTVELTTTVLSDSDDTTSAQFPAVVIHGLSLECAQWSPSDKCLRVPSTARAVSTLPPVLLTPAVRRLQTHAPVINGSSVVSAPTATAEAVDGASSPSPSVGVYRCPLYRTMTRAGALSTAGHSTNFVMWLTIPSGYKPHWRRTLPSEPGFLEGAWVADCQEWICAGVAAFLSPSK
jgi:hypothetical protein